MTNNMLVTLPSAESILKGKWEKVLADTRKLYDSVGQRLHVLAAYSLHHAATHSDPRKLTDFFNILRINDQDALRIWIGEYAKCVDPSDIDEETGEPRVKPFLRYSTATGFTFIKGSKPVVADFTLENMLGTTPFMSLQTKNSGARQLGWEEILAYLLKVKPQVEKKAEKAGLAMPDEFVGLLQNLESSVKTFDAHRIAAEAEQARLAEIAKNAKSKGKGKESDWKPRKATGKSVANQNNKTDGDESIHATA